MSPRRHRRLGRLGRLGRLRSTGRGTLSARIRPGSPRRLRAAALGALCLSLLAASSGARASSLVRASLVADTAAAAPGVPFHVAVRLEVPPSWHIYWKNPGETGLAPRIRWRNPPGVRTGHLLWPTPSQIRQGNLVTFGYEGDVWLLAEVRPGQIPVMGDPLRLSAEVEWLVCQDTCIPESAVLDLPVRLELKPQPGALRAIFAEVRARLPRRLGWPTSLGAAPEGDSLLELTVKTGALPLPGGEAYFFPEEEGVIEPAAPQELTLFPDGFSLRLKRAKAAGGRPPPGHLAGVVVLRGPIEGDALSVEITTAPPPAFEPPALFGPTALVFALLGGLLLNLMPCVLPVVGIKILGLVQHGQGSLRRAQLHGLAFGAGILGSFWLIAGALLLLRATGRELGWGFQLQSPTVVALLALLFFGLGLVFLEVVVVGAAVQNLAGQVGPRLADGLWGSFGSGMLATAVATPCTGPFMGAAIGAAITAPWPLAFAIFTALGVGMALPYVLLTRFPAALRLIPKRGRWTELLQQALAFPLFGASLWLLSVLGAQAGLGRVLVALGSMGVAGFAAWLWRVAGPTDAPPIRRKLFGAASLALLLAAASANTAAVDPPPLLPGAAAEREAASPIDWVAWSADRLASLRAERRPVFVDFTAAWCLTCQVNERAVFGSREVRDRFAALGVVPMRADWTRSDPAITRALAAFGRSGVPLAVLYLKGAAEPMVLPAVLTPGIVLEALAQLEDPK
jgi:thiol:disulfide interchange protein DsbD